MEGRYRYSNEIVYNNFPWPIDPSQKNKEIVIENARKVLEIRKQFKDCSLADLYNSLSMPPILTKAHKELDGSVDNCYRSKKFKNEKERIEFLFNLFTEYIRTLF